VSVIPCAQDARLRKEIARFAEALKTEAHALGDHGLSEKEFYESPILRGAIERIRGEYAATMRHKKAFVQNVLNHMEDRGFIAGWDPAEGRKRHDYHVRLNSGRLAVIDLKGCLDGNNTTISERPDAADEFVVWSICTNLGGDPRRNAWSGIHTRLSADMLSRGQQIDGLIIWDMLCGSSGRLCPKLVADGQGRRTSLGAFDLPPPCIYLFPASVPSQEKPSGVAQPLENVEILSAFHACFHGRGEELNHVQIDIEYRGDDIFRRTQVMRAGIVQHSSGMTVIRRA